MSLHTKTRSTLFAALASAAFWLHAAPALADETQGERLFRDGRVLMLDGRFDEACPMLEESQRLEPHVGTLLNVAACHERQGKVGSAWVEYQKAMTAARAEGQAERVQLASERIKVLDPRVPWLRISSTSDDVAIALDGGRIEHVAWGQEMPVDPGPHAVTAERNGAKVFEERLELREGEHRAIRIDLGDAPPATRPEQERVIVEPKPSESPAAAPKKKGSWVLEPGLFFGVMGGSAGFPTASEATLGSHGLTPRTSTGQSTDCARRTCAVGELRGTTGGVAGLDLFAGYAVSDQVTLGARFMAAPSLGASGNSLYGFGPSIALHATEAFTIGAWAFFGDATVRGTAQLSPPSDYSLADTTPVHADGNLAGGFGLGVELSLRLFEIGRGEVRATASPLFIAGGRGSAALLPLGLAYRFQ